MTTPIVAERNATEVIAGWRAGEPDNPAGSLFTGGGYTEHELTMTGNKRTQCGTACTYSIGKQCC